MTYRSLSIFIAVALAAIALAAVSALEAEPAAAALPGENGRIAYDSDDAGYPEHNDIWAMNPDGTGHLNLTRNQPCCNWDADWSPDGSKLAFTSDRDGRTEVYVMDADGSDPVRLTDGPAASSRPVWSPDGERIAFLTASGNGLPGAYPTIHVVNSDGSGEPTDLGVRAYSYYGSHSWSPNGEKIAFVGRNVPSGENGCGHDEIFVVNADGSGDPEQMTHHAEWDCEYVVYSPDWSPDGSEIAYSDGDDSYSYASAVYIIGADGSGQKRVLGVPFDSAAYRHGGKPSWSPDGTKIALVGSFAAKTGEATDQILTRNADGSGTWTSLTSLWDCKDQCREAFNAGAPDWGTAPPVPVPTPDTAITAGPSGSVSGEAARFELLSGLRVVRFECSLDGAAFAPCEPPVVYTGLSTGTHTFEARAIDAAGHTDNSPATRTWTVDAVAPKVKGVGPANRAKGVTRGTDLVAAFSEKMDPSTITKSTFKVYKCSPSTRCADRINNVTVTLDYNGRKAFLEPYGTSATKLKANTRYKAVVTIGAKDSAGNPLDQSAMDRGNQQKAWFFTTGGR